MDSLKHHAVPIYPEIRGILEHRRGRIIKPNFRHTKNKQHIIDTLVEA